MENEKKGFQVIAIKTGKKPKRVFKTHKTGAKLDPFKILKEDKIYSLDSNFVFNDNDFNNIEIKDFREPNLYSIEVEKREVPINISAIVGANGSGKSSLIELIFWANYNIGCALQLLKDERGKKLQPYKFLELEIFFSKNERFFYLYRFINGRILKRTYSLSYSSIILEESSEYEELKDIKQLSDFFYTIVINYSHYALNSREIGDWIKHLFHKNDGYQTPIVLNPMRTEGNININRENDLLKRRLQANLLEEVSEKTPIKETLRNVANDKIATQFRLTYYSVRNTNLEEPKDLILQEQLLTALKKYFGLNISQQQLDDDMFVNVSINYLIEKLLKISVTYKSFSKFYKKGPNSSIKYIDAYLKKIKTSNSHIVFKVKGVILYLKYCREIFGSDIVYLNDQITLDINDLSVLTKRISQQEDFWINTFMMTPPSFLNSEIILSDGSPLNSLSSGEMQRIHSMSSIAYHLIYLNSVGKINRQESDDLDYMDYRNINLILDEIELYYHPEWQRKYVSDLLSYLSKINKSNLSEIDSINITFLTHSPYILSDIPNSNVLKLKSGECEIVDDEKTLGANIHDLITNSFYMESTTGEFLKGKVKEIIKFHFAVKIAENNELGKLREDYSLKRSEYNYIVDNIGEEVISGILKNHIEFIEERFELN